MIHWGSLGVPISFGPREPSGAPEAGSLFYGAHFCPPGLSLPSSQAQCPIEHALFFKDPSTWVGPVDMKGRREAPVSREKRWAGCGKLQRGPRNRELPLVLPQLLSSPEPPKAPRSPLGTLMPSQGTLHPLGPPSTVQDPVP